MEQLRGWAKRYDDALRADREGELAAIGSEMFAWLDESGWASAWANGADDRTLEIAVPGDKSFAETALLDRAAESDVGEAEAAIERFATASADEGLVIRDIWLLRLRALLARTRGDEAAYRDFRDRYRDRARSLGFEGHIVWAEAMP